MGFQDKVSGRMLICGNSKTNSNNGIAKEIICVCVCACAREETVVGGRASSVESGLNGHPSRLDRWISLAR
jgi:hypothetical protein